MALVPVEYDPFAGAPQAGGPKLVPVEYDPFQDQKPKYNLQNAGTALMQTIKDFPNEAILDPIRNIGAMAYGDKPILTGNLKESFGNVATLAMPFMTGGAMPKGLTAGLTEAEGAAALARPNLVQGAINNLKQNAMTPAPAYSPLKTMGATSDAFFAAVDKANTFYGFPKKLGEGQFIDAPRVKNYLGSIIDDVNNSVSPHEARSQVGTLQRIYDALPEDGTVPVNDLLDLRKFTNRYFDPARLSDKSATYGKFNSVIDSGLNTAKQEIPNFGSALDIADNFWRNNVSEPFLKNKILQKTWSPSDAYNLRMARDGFIDEPSDLTKQRADNLVGNVKDVNSYNAIRRTLPNDIGSLFDKKLLESMPSGRLEATARTLYHGIRQEYPSAIRNFGDVLNPQLTPEQKIIIQAVKKQNTFTPLSQKNDLAQADFEKLTKADMMGEGHPLALPPPNIRPPYGGGGVSAGESFASAPDVPFTGMRQLRNDFYAPSSRALPYYQRPDFVGAPDGGISKVPPNSGYMFGEYEGTPFQAGERRNINAQSGDHQPLGKYGGQRALLLNSRMPSYMRKILSGKSAKLLSGR